MRGLLPTRFVHTLNVPSGVLIGIIRTPPLSTSSRPVLSKYFDAVAGGGAATATAGVGCGAGGHSALRHADENATHAMAIHAARMLETYHALGPQLLLDDHAT